MPSLWLYLKHVVIFTKNTREGVTNQQLAKYMLYYQALLQAQPRKFQKQVKK